MKARTLKLGVSIRGVTCRHIILQRLKSVKKTPINSSFYFAKIHTFVRTDNVDNSSLYTIVFVLNIREK